MWRSSVEQHQRFSNIVEATQAKVRMPCSQSGLGLQHAIGSKTQFKNTNAVA